MTHSQKKAIYTLRQHPVARTREQTAAEYTLRNRGENQAEPNAMRDGRTR